MRNDCEVTLVRLLMIGLLSAPSIAAADSSCGSLIAEKAKQANGQWYKVEITMHRENVKFVSYSVGALAPNSDGSFAGHSNQIFSDRMSGQQPFNINAADNLDLKLSKTGLLQIHYKPWNFDTSWDLSCKGSVLTTYVPGFGIVTLTFRDQFIPIQ